MCSATEGGRDLHRRRTGRRRSTLQPGEIRDSNRRTLLTLVAEAGWEAVDLGMRSISPTRSRRLPAGAVEWMRSSRRVASRWGRSTM